MKTNLGKPLTKKELKEIKAGGPPGGCIPNGVSCNALAPNCCSGFCNNAGSDFGICTQP